MSFLNIQQVRLTKRHLVQNVTAKKCFCSKERTKDIIKDDNRVSFLKKILNFEGIQGWKTVDGID